MADKAGIRKIVSELGGLMGIPDLALDADDQCQLAIDGKIPVALEYDEDGERFILSSPVGSLPAERREPVLERLLDANLFWKDTGGAVLGLERKRSLAAAAFSRVLALAVIARLVGGDAEQPGLKLASTMEGFEVPDDGQEDFLANLLDVLARKVVAELEDKAPRCRVMPVEQFVPGLRFTPAAARNQLNFSIGTHAESDSI